MLRLFLLLDIFFGILLIFATFLQTYYDIYFFHILSFSFYLLQISFYLFLACSLNLSLSSSDKFLYLFFACSLNLSLSFPDKFLYLSLACSLNLYHFRNNLLFYLILFLYFFDSKLYYSFFI